MYLCWGDGRSRPDQVRLCQQHGGHVALDGPEAGVLLQEYLVGSCQVVDLLPQVLQLAVKP